MTATTATAPVVARATSSTDARRWLQLRLAAIWLLDGILQAQTFMFTKGFATSMLAPAASGNPGWIAASVRWTAHLVEAAPLAWNIVFSLVQVALGLGIAFRPTLRIALAGSIAWALVVWWFGEGLGGLLTGSASALGGAPGGALLYAVAAVLLWPVPPGAPRGRFVAERPVGAVASRAVWLALWLGLAALNLQPANLAPDAVHDTVSGMGAGQPTWVTAIVDGLARASRGHGAGLSILGAVIMALIAIGILLGRRASRAAVIAAIVVSAVIWVAGEALGAVFGGQATDPNSGPLLILIALAYWPHSLAEDSNR